MIDMITLQTDKILTAGFESEIQNIPEIPGNNILGYGYDIFDLYADPRSATTQLFDLPTETYLENVGNKVYKVPLAVTVHRLAEGHRELIVGHTIQEFQERFSLQAGLSGSYGYFSGSIESSFSSDVVRESEWEFITLDDSTQSWLVELPQPDDLRQYLKPSFKNDLLYGDPKSLFDKYGTHFVREAIIGGKCDFNCYVSRTLEISQTDIELQVKAGYTSLTGSVNFQSGVGLSTDYKTFERTYNAKLSVKGGDPASAFRLADGSVQGGGFSAWAATVDDDPVLVDFTRKSLSGIWELCEDQTRRAQLLDYYENTILPGKKPIIPNATKVELEGRFIVDMQSVATDEDSGSNWNVEFFAPDLTRYPGYRSLGHYAQGGDGYRYGSSPFGTVLIVKEITAGSAKPALQEPVAFSPVWDDTNSGGKHDINIWRPVAPDGYVALGFVVTRGDRKRQPSKGSAMCVRQDLVDDASFGNLIWSDRGSGADRDVSLYQIQPNPAYAKPTGLFWAQPNHDRASGKAWCPLSSILKMA